MKNVKHMILKNNFKTQCITLKFLDCPLLNDHVRGVSTVQYMQYDVTDVTEVLQQCYEIIHFKKI